MVKEWGFRLRPSLTSSQFRYLIILGYPFGADQPPIVIPIPTSTIDINLNYFKTYLGGNVPTGPILINNNNNNLIIITNDKDLAYFKAYLTGPQAAPILRSANELLIVSSDKDLNYFKSYLGKRI